MTTTRLVPIDRDRPNPGLLDEAGACLRDGGLVAFATETVYGLGADATRKTAIQRIYDAKGRPPTNPLIVHVCDLAMARRFAAAWPADAERLAQAFWPGPVTLVVPRAPAIPDAVTAGLPTVGLRVPAPAVARGLIEAAGVPVAAPSANRSEHVSPTTARHVLDDLDGRVDILLDSGPADLGIESAVVDVAGDTPRLLRPGPLRLEQLEEALGRPIGRGMPAVGEGPQSSPGQHARHYAPHTPCLRVESFEALEGLALTGRDIVLSCGRRDAMDLVGEHVVLDRPDEAARRLYATLRELDAGGYARIVLVMPPDVAGWEAIRDRLRRASVKA